MLDHSRRGHRCQSLTVIRCVEGSRIQPGEQGTVQHELTEGPAQQHMVFVQWDRGPAGYAFPREIEIT